MIHFKNTTRLAVSAGLCASLMLGATPVVALADDVARPIPVERESATPAPAAGTEVSASSKAAGVADDSAAELADDGVIDTVTELQAAFDAAADGVLTTVTLGGNIEFGGTEVVTVPAGKVIKLNMANHKITCTAEFTGRPIVNEGTLTVEGDGVIDTSKSPSGGYGAINNKGNLTIIDGTYRGAIYADGSSIRNTGKDANLVIENGLFEGATSAVYNEGSVEINGGSFIGETCSQCNSSIWAYTIRNYNTDAKMIINGGYFEGVQGAVSASVGSLTVNDGTFKSVKCKKNPSHTATFYALYAAGEYGEVVCTINGGTFETEGTVTAVAIGNDNTNGDGGINAQATGYINGGTFKAPDGVPAIIGAKNTGDPVIKGGTFLSGDEAFNLPTHYLAPGFKLDAETGTVVENENTVATVSVNGEVIGAYEQLDEALKNAPKGSTVVLKKDAAGNGVVVESGAEFTLDLGGHTFTIDGETVGSEGTKTNGFQLLKDSTLTFRNGTIKSDKAAILIQNYCNFTLEDVTLEGGKNTMATLSNNNGEVLIGEGTNILAGQASPKVAFDVCRFGSYEGVSVTVAEDAGKIDGLIQLSVEKSTNEDGDFALTINGGDLSKAVIDMAAGADKATITKSLAASISAPEGYLWLDGKLVKKGGDESEAVASITTDSGVVNKFSSVQEAINAVPENGKATIELLANVSGEEQMKFLQPNHDITLNMNGHTYTAAGGEGVNVNAANLVLTIKDGKIVNKHEGEYSDGIYVYSRENSGSHGVKLTLDGVTVESRTQGLAINGTCRDSEITIKDSRIVSDEEPGIYYPPAGVLNIVDSTITGTTGMVLKGGKVNISGKSAVKGFGPEVVPEENYQGGDTGFNDTGDAIYVEAGYASDLNLNISGGTFESANAQAIRFFEKEGSETGAKYEFAVSGGTFSTPLNEGWIVPGCGLTKNADGTFGVHKHLLTKVAAKSATCTEDGIVEHWACSECDVLFKDEAMTEEIAPEDVVVKATGHDVAAAIHHEGKAATVDAEGVIEHWECPVCHALFLDEGLTKPVSSEDVVLPKLDPEPEKVNKGALSQLIGDAKQMSTEGKSEKVVAEYKAALAKAIAVFEDKDATQDEVDAAFARLSAALTALDADKGEPGEGEKPGPKPETKPDEGEGDATAKGDALPTTGDDSMLPIAVAGVAGVAAVAAGVAVTVKRRKQQ